MREIQRRVLTTAFIAASLLGETACVGRSFLRNEGVRTVPEANYREPLTRVELAQGKGYYLANASRDSGAAYGNARPYLIVDVGNATPIFAVSNKPLDRNPAIPYAACNDDPPALDAGTDMRCQKTLQFTIPVAFYLFWDVFSDNNPIVDTDYTFGFDLSARAAFWKHTETRAGAYWGHISTHVGDEYVISGRLVRDVPGARFPRVNVSYWPWRVNASQRFYSKTGTGARSYLQIGGELEGSCLKCGDTSYYYTYPTESAGLTIPTIGPGMEWTVTGDWRLMVDGPHQGPANLTNLERPSVNFGVLVGSRRIFPYLNADSSQHYGTAINATVGYRFPVGVGTAVHHTQFYVRGYYGPNPYGQLRNQRSFYLFGLGAKILH